MSYDESFDEESNGVGMEDPKTPSPDEQQSLGEAKSGEKTPGTRTRLSDLEKFQLLNDDRIKLLDQELPRGERRLIVDQLKVGHLFMQALWGVYGSLFSGKTHSVCEQIVKTVTKKPLFFYHTTFNHTTIPRTP